MFVYALDWFSSEIVSLMMLHINFIFCIWLLVIDTDMVILIG